MPGSDAAKCELSSNATALRSASSCSPRRVLRLRHFSASMPKARVGHPMTGSSSCALCRRFRLRCGVFDESSPLRGIRTGMMRRSMVFGTRQASMRRQTQHPHRQPPHPPRGRGGGVAAPLVQSSGGDQSASIWLTNRLENRFAERRRDFRRGPQRRDGQSRRRVSGVCAGSRSLPVLRRDRQPSACRQRQAPATVSVLERNRSAGKLRFK